MWVALLIASFLAIVHGSVISRTSGDPNCPTGYSNKDTVHCYKVFTKPKTRAAAQAHCESDGGYLASPTNVFDNNYNTTLGQEASVPDMWLGTECFNGNKANCGNANGEKFGPYDNFYPNNPSTLGNCVYLSNSNPIGYWLSFNCMSDLPYVCEFKYGSREPPCPPLYNWFNGTCYKVVNQTMTYTAAQLTCQGLPGRNFAVIPSTEVNTYVVDLAKPYNTPYDTVYRVGFLCQNVTFVGDTSSCFWADLSPFTYTNFMVDRPLDGYPFGFLETASGLWEDGGEGGIGKFICQAPTLD